MKPRKIKRRSISRRRSYRAGFAWKIVLTVAACAALLVGGVLTAHWIIGEANTPTPPTPQTTVPTTVTTTTATTTTTTTAPTVPPLPEGKWLYVPTETLRDTAALERTLDRVVKAGRAAIVFDLKDEDGWVRYASATAEAASAQSVAKDALTRDELTAVQALCADRGLAAIPRLYAFCDAVGAEYLPLARVMYDGDPARVWRDNKGRTWLNPYATAARSYLTALAAELHEWGFARIAFEGVEFPTDTKNAYFGKSTLTHEEILTQFLTEAQAAVGGNEVLLPSAAPYIVYR